MVFYTSELMFNDLVYFSKSNRRFNNSLIMCNNIISPWNRVVSDSDDVYIIGGVGEYEYLKSLNGRKHLVMSSYEVKLFEEWRKELTDDPKDDIDLELYGKFLKEYGISSVATSGRLMKKTYTGRLVWLTTDPKHRRDDVFNLYGCVGDLQKLVSSGVNCSIAVNNYYPISETEIEYYAKSLNKLI